MARCAVVRCPLRNLRCITVVVGAAMLLTACGNNREPPTTFGPVRWVGVTDIYPDSMGRGPALVANQDELRELLTTRDGQTIELTDDVRNRIDFERHHVALVSVAEANSCHRAYVEQTNIDRDVVTIVVRIDVHEGTCLEMVSTHGLVLTLDRARWTQPPELAVEYPDGGRPDFEPPDGDSLGYVEGAEAAYGLHELVLPAHLADGPPLCVVAFDGRDVERLKVLLGPQAADEWRVDLPTAVLFTGEDAVVVERIEQSGATATIVTAEQTARGDDNDATTMQMSRYYLFPLSDTTTDVEIVGDRQLACEADVPLALLPVWAILPADRQPGVRCVSLPTDAAVQQFIDQLELEEGEPTIPAPALGITTLPGITFLFHEFDPDGPVPLTLHATGDRVAAEGQTGTVHLVPVPTGTHRAHLHVNGEAVGCLNR